MSMERNALLIAGILLFGTFCAFSAMAEVHHPEAYENLTAVELAPGNAPRLLNGVSELSGSEHGRQERLPMQLTGAMKRLQKAKYKGGSIRRQETRRL